MVDEKAGTRAILGGLAILALAGRGSASDPPEGAEPTASFDVQTSAGHVEAQSTATDPDDRITLYDWELRQNGAIVSFQTGQTFSADVEPGSYTLLHRVTSSSGQTAENQESVVVPQNGSGGSDGGSNQDPTAAFRRTIDGLTIDCVSESSDPDGFIASYSWDLRAGAGQPDYELDEHLESASGQTVTFTVPSEGRWRVYHSVTDNDGATDLVVDFIDVGGGPVLNEPPTAAFDYSLDGFNLFLDGRLSYDTDGRIVQYEWEVYPFGDPENLIASGTGPTFGTDVPAGDLEVALRVTDDRGASDTARQSFTSSGAHKMLSWDLGEQGPWEQTIYSSQRLIDENGRAPEQSVAVALHNALKGIDVSHEIRYGFAPRNPPNNRSTCCNPAKDQCSRPDGEADAIVWWKDRVYSPESDFFSAKDSNLLCVYNDRRGGGCAGVGGIAAVVGVGRITSDLTYLPGPHPASAGEYVHVHGALHEVGHNMGFGHDPHGGIQQNNDRKQWWERTPTVGTDSQSTNVCGQVQEGREYNQTAFLNWYGPCVEQEIRIK